MPTLRRGFRTAVVDGKIYVIGGAIFDRQRDVRVATDLVEAYDPLTGRWRKRTRMPTKRTWVDAAVMNNKIYAIGGEISPRLGVPLADAILTKIEEYNPKTDRWRKLPDMPMFKFAYSTVAVDRKIYLIGGYSLDNGFKDLASVDVYEPSLKRWGSIPALPSPKMAPSVAVNGVIYVLGGFVRGRFSQAVQTFDTGFRAVSPKDKLSTRWGEMKKSN
jgi:N-acetylneuraminic acid mutarotase